jgi:hypothetical protein
MYKLFYELKVDEMFAYYIVGLGNTLFTKCSDNEGYVLYDKIFSDKIDKKYIFNANDLVEIV